MALGAHDLGEYACHCVCFMDSSLTLAEICVALVVAAHAGVLALRLSVSLFKA